MFVLGLDGGGTKTAAVVLEKGEERCRFTVGGINYNSFPKEEIHENFRLLCSLLREQGYEPETCGGIGIGAAGVSNPQAAPFLKEAIARAGFTCPVEIAGDDVAALLGGVGRQAGILLIAGTGSACLAQDAEGRRIRVGGYGHLIDDQGSAYAIACGILSAVVQAYDGRAEATGLTQAVYARLGIREIGELIAYLYDGKTGKKEIAQLASLLTEEMTAYDAAAERIARKAASDLVWLVRTAVRRLCAGTREPAGDARERETPLPLLREGSVICRNPVVMRLFSEELAQSGTPVYLADKRKDAACGAASLVEHFEH